MGRGFEPTLQIAGGWLLGKHVFLREHLFCWKRGSFGSYGYVSCEAACG